MVLWVGVIGKLIELVLGEIVGKHVDLRLDDRKRAARAFLDLHDALGRLEGVAAAFCAAVEPTLDGRRSYLWRQPLESMARAGDDASRALINAVRDLRRIILIYDEDLAQILGGIVDGKGFLIEALSGQDPFEKMTFGVQRKGDGLLVAYSAPSDQLLTAAPETIVRQLYARPDELKWRRNLLLSFVHDNLVEGHMTDEDIEHARRLHGIVVGQAPLLRKARVALEAFLRKNFSFEDLLYVGVKR